MLRAVEATQLERIMKVTNTSGEALNVRASRSPTIFPRVPAPPPAPSPVPGNGPGTPARLRQWQPAGCEGMRAGMYGCPSTFAAQVTIATGGLDPAFTVQPAAGVLSVPAFGTQSLYFTMAIGGEPRTSVSLSQPGPSRSVCT